MLVALSLSANGTMAGMQDHFDAVMKDYPDSWRAMDLIAKHRLRTLHSSSAWHSKQDALVSKSASLGAKIEYVLEVRALLQICSPRLYPV